MGYPMTWGRLVSRNQLAGDYAHNPAGQTTPPDKQPIAGDMRRLEKDTLDDHHLALYAEIGGCDRLTVHRIFEAFFDSTGRARQEAYKNLARLADNESSRDGGS